METFMAMTAQKATTRSLPQEFEQMFRAHHELVFRAAYRVTGNAEDAEDVLQTLFLRLLRRECPPQFETSPKAYLHRAAINIALDILKTKSRNVSTDEIENHIEDQRPGPDRERDASEIQNWLRTALAELNPRTAEMFVLRHLEGYDNAEIAKMMGTSRGTVAVMLFRARLRLQKSIKTHLGELI
jgi:RNA polymerase sigma-70 factor, ECF subfamily